MDPGVTMLTRQRQAVMPDRSVDMGNVTVNSDALALQKVDLDPAVDDGRPHRSGGPGDGRRHRLVTAISGDLTLQADIGLSLWTFRGRNYVGWRS